MPAGAGSLDPALSLKDAVFSPQDAVFSPMPRLRGGMLSKLSSFSPYSVFTNGSSTDHWIAEHVLEWNGAICLWFCRKESMSHAGCFRLSEDKGIPNLRMTETLWVMAQLNSTTWAASLTRSHSPSYVFYFFFFLRDGVSLCYPGWSAMAGSQLPATCLPDSINSPASASQVAGITGIHHPS